MSKDTLTEKQKAFCDYYLESLNATEAYMKAYKPKNPKSAESGGSRTLRIAKVDKYIKERMESLAGDRIAPVEEILEFLTKGMRGELQEQIALNKLNQLGALEQELIWKDISIKDQIKCAELLGKRYRIFTEKIEAEVTERVVIIDDL